MKRAFAPLILLLGTGCAGSAASTPKSLTLAFPAVHADAGGEVLGKCQSWTLNNDQPLYLNTVTMAAGPGWHHSNWFFVPDTHYAGPDGTWDCSTRNFDEFGAASSGGVLFAQSTQATSDVQAFPSYAAVVIPAHARIVGGIHLVNAGDTAIDTAITLTLDFIPPSQATVHLQPMSLAFEPLDLYPHAVTTAYGACDSSATPMHFSIYYLLPHYHYLGTAMDVTTHKSDGTTIDVFHGTSPIGQPWGKTYDPPLSVSTSDELTFSCTWNNVTDDEKWWGNADGEMCVLLAFTDSPKKWAGGVLGNLTSLTVGTAGNPNVETGNCLFGPI